MSIYSSSQNYSYPRESWCGSISRLFRPSNAMKVLTAGLAILSSVPQRASAESLHDRARELTVSNRQSPDTFPTQSRLDEKIPFQPLDKNETEMAIKNSGPALIIASQKGDIKMVKKLLDNNKTDLTGDDLALALQFAGRNNQKEVVKELLTKTIQYTSSEHAGWALMVASRYGYKEIVKELLNNNRMLICSEHAGWAMIYALRNGDQEIVNELQTREAWINSALKLASSNDRDKDLLGKFLANKSGKVDLFSNQTLRVSGMILKFLTMATFIATAINWVFDPLIPPELY